jgi:mitochondrial Rho GTPase 1
LIIVVVDDDGGVMVEEQLKSCDAICLVYAVNSPTAFDRLLQFWLPYIRSKAEGRPIILVGNKIDLRADGEDRDILKQRIVPLMTQAKEIETCIEASAKEILNVAEVFYFGITTL